MSVNCFFSLSDDLVAQVRQGREVCATKPYAAHSDMWLQGY